MAAAIGNIDVFIESGSRRVFASALDWPGWVLDHLWEIEDKSE